MSYEEGGVAMQPTPPSGGPQRRRKKVCPVTNTSGDSCPISDIFNKAIDSGVQIQQPIVDVEVISRRPLAARITRRAFDVDLKMEV